MSKAKISLGDRMKDFYESRSKHKLLRRMYTIVRIDGQSFKTYTKKLKRPFDDGLMEDMDDAAAYACSKIQGAKLAFVQSDEISILITDFEDISTDAWFDNDSSKLTSLTSSYISTKFNQLRMLREIKKSFFINGEAGFVEKNSVEKTIKEIKLAEFDSRAFQLPTKTETINYFIWRQQDIIRNSISSAARVHSDKELHNVNSDEKINLLKEKGVDWDNIDNYYKNGRIIYKQTNPESQRSQWICTSTPKFTENKEFISSLIPENT